MPPQLRLRVASHSDVGLVRSHNEDDCAAFANDEGAQLLVVADGMGGHRGGATASRLAVEAMRTAFAYVEETETGDDFLTSAICDANQRVHEASVNDTSLRGMGTTLVALYLSSGGKAYVGHVGDSRAYLFRDHRLEALTEDHSVVAELIRRGLVTEEEGMVHPRRNEILRSVGIEPRVSPEVREIDMKAGDRFVLCSDGLCGVIRDAEIAELLVDAEPEQIVNSLIDAANDAGGPDNVTVQLGVVESVKGGSHDTSSESASRAGEDSGGAGLSLGLIAILLTGLLFFAWRIWH